VTSITGDGFERSGVIFDAGGGKYRYGNLWVGAYTDHEVRLGGAAIPAGLPFSTVSLRDKAAVAYFHIHPDNGVLNSYDNSKFSDHDADFFRQAIRNHKNLSEMYLGGSDGSFVQMTRQLVESTIFGHHYFDVPRTSLPRVILRPSFGRE
jgi:hypothetical protein